MPEFLRAKLKKIIREETKQRSYRRTVKRGAGAVAVLLLIFIGIGTVSPASARNIPVLHSIFEIFQGNSDYYKGYIPYSQLVDKSVTDQGVTLTINEALADDSTLIIGYTVKSYRKIDASQLAMLMSFLRINGGLPQGGGSSGEYLDDKTYVSVSHIYYRSPSDSDQLQIDFNVEQIMDVKGHWDFSFAVSKDELQKRTLVIKASNKVDLPEGMVTIDKVVLTPIDSTIQFSGNYKDQDAATKAMDEVVYWWFVFDDQGRDLMSGGGMFGGTNAPEGKDFQGEAKFQAVKEIPSYITVVPCRFPVVSADEAKANNPAESLKVIDGNYPLELPQGKMGKLVIQDIETADGETTVRFTAEGKAPYFQGTHLYLKDADGEYLHSKYGIRRDEEHPNDFTMVFPPLEAGKQYSIGTSRMESIDFMEDLRFKIELWQ